LLKFNEKDDHLLIKGDSSIEEFAERVLQVIGDDDDCWVKLIGEDRFVEIDYINKGFGFYKSSDNAGFVLVCHHIHHFKSNFKAQFQAFFDSNNENKLLHVILSGDVGEPLEITNEPPLKSFIKLVVSKIRERKYSQVRCVMTTLPDIIYVVHPFNAPPYPAMIPMSSDEEDVEAIPIASVTLQEDPVHGAPPLHSTVQDEIMKYLQMFPDDDAGFMAKISREASTFRAHRAALSLQEFAQIIMNHVLTTETTVKLSSMGQFMTFTLRNAPETDHEVPSNSPCKVLRAEATHGMPWVSHSLDVIEDEQKPPEPVYIIKVAVDFPEDFPNKERFGAEKSVIWNEGLTVAELKQRILNTLALDALDAFDAVKFNAYMMILDEHPIPDYMVIWKEEVERSWTLVITLCSDDEDDGDEGRCCEALNKKLSLIIVNTDTKEEFILRDVKQFDTIFNVKTMIAEMKEIDDRSFKLKYKAKTLQLHHNLYDYGIWTDEYIYMSCSGLHAGGYVKKTIVKTTKKPASKYRGYVTLGGDDDESEEVVANSKAKVADAEAEAEEAPTPPIADVRSKVESYMSLLRDHKGATSPVGDLTIAELKKGLDLVDTHGVNLMTVIFSTMDKAQVRELTSFTGNALSSRLKVMCEAIFFHQLQKLERIKKDYELSVKAYSDLTLLGVMTSYGSKGFIGWTAMKKDVIDALMAVPTEETKTRKESLCTIS
jgi:hypothetical protein